MTSASILDPPRSPPALDLHSLRPFLVVAEELHFGRAATGLAMAQPPLSQLVTAARWGILLFDFLSRVSGHLAGDTAPLGST